MRKTVSALNCFEMEMDSEYQSARRDVREIENDAESWIDEVVVSLSIGPNLCQIELRLRSDYCLLSYVYLLPGVRLSRFEAYDCLLFRSHSFVMFVVHRLG